MDSLNISPSIPQFTILKDQTAASSLDRKANSIQQGRKMTRLALDGVDSRFHVAAKVINKSNFLDRLKGQFYRAHHYVKLETSDKQVILVHVDSVASRLHLKKEDVLKAAKKGELRSLIANGMQNASSILANYEKITSQYKFNEKNELVSQESPMPAGLTSKLLMKVIRTALTTELEYTKKGAHEITIKETHTFIAQLENQNLELAYISQILGNGSYGTAYSFLQLNQAAEQVLKIALPDPEAEKDLKNEYHVLQQIHANGKQWGLQLPPTKYLVMSEGIIEEGTTFLGMQRVGYSGVKYQSNYGEYCLQNTANSDNLNNYLMDFHQLLFGLQYLDKFNLLHSDIKPQNILVKKEGQVQLTHIADMGGARYASQTAPNTEIYTSVRTPPYIFEEDFSQSRLLSFNEQEKDALIQLEKKCDTFAMGCVLYSALTGMHPYNLGDNGHPIPGSFAPLQMDWLPQDMKDLIAQMLDEDPEKRPSGSEAFQRLDAFIQKNNPELHEQILDAFKNY